MCVCNPALYKPCAYDLYCITACFIFKAWGGWLIGVVMQRQKYKGFNTKQIFVEGGKNLPPALLLRILLGIKECKQLNFFFLNPVY